MKNLTAEITVNDGCDAKEINRILSEAENGSTIVFSNCEYFLDEPIVLFGKNDMTLMLGNAVFRPYFDNTNGSHVPTRSIDAFNIENCENLQIHGGIIKSAVPTNVKGKITAVTEEYLEIRLFPELPLDGTEKFVHGRSLDELMRPCAGYIHDYKPTSKTYESVKNDRIIFARQIACTNHPFCSMEIEFVEENLCRIRNIYKCNFKVGMDCTLGHIYYGNCAFTFTACQNVLMDSTCFRAFGGMGVVILPDSRDFVFRNMKMKSDSKYDGVEPIQSDGIHIAGLGGKLIIDNCYWEYTIDDALNAHAQLLTVSEENCGRISLIYDKLCGKVFRHWAKPGETLRVYDKETKLLKGVVNILSCGTDFAVTDADKLGIQINVGDFISNPALFCNIEIKNCTLVSCSGGFKLRSVNSAHVHDCTFIGVKKSISLSVAFATTKEAGPVKDVLIEKNKFVDSGYDSIIYSGVYSGDMGEFRHLHKNVTIRENMFINSTARSIVELIATDKVLIENNIMKNCKSTFFEFSLCDDVTCRNNKAE